MDKHSLNNCSEIKKLFNLFPWHWREGLRVVDINKLTEIRIRVGQPIILQLSMEKFYLGKNGLSNEVNDLIYPTQKEIEEIVFLVCNKSIYAYLPELLNGFLHYESGIRIGVCGEPVWNNEKIVNIRNFTSLNIRIPHEVKNCSLKLKKYFLDPLKSVLIISKPGNGKTTFLRDMLFQLKGSKINTLIIDERKEIAGLINGYSSFNLNNSFDIISNGNKKAAIEWGIRSMSPELIVCDEIFIEDLETLKFARRSGVEIFATVHSDTMENAEDKLKLNASNEGIFDLFVVLNDDNGVGTISGLFNSKKMRIL